MMEIVVDFSKFDVSLGKKLCLDMTIINSKVSPFPSNTIQ